MTSLYVYRELNDSSKKKGATMAQFVLGYHGGGGEGQTEAEMAEIMGAWGAWMGSLGSALVNPGNPIAASATIGTDGSVSDGGGSNPLTGYSVIEADSLDTAVTLAKGCPIFASGGSVEVGETVPM